MAGGFHPLLWELRVCCTREVGRLATRLAMVAGVASGLPIFSSRWPNRPSHSFL